MNPFLQKILLNLPEVAPPATKKLSFKEKLKWTGICLVLFFVLSLVPLFGLGQNQLQRFEILSVILGASFGSILSLGIGPLVTSSIVLQLLNGSGILKFNLQEKEGRQQFQGLQKMSSFFFIIFEAAIYVFMGGLAPPENLLGTVLYFQLELLLVFQLFLGGLIVMFMDEVCSKWGFGSGISLFIAAGVSQSVFIRALSPLPSPTNPSIATGAIPALFQSLAAGDPQTALLMFSTVASTVLIFVVAVYAQAMKVEIPLSFGRIRGHGIRWPLNFIYTSNIPVILISALIANIQLWARLFQSWGYPLLGTFSGNTPTSGFVAWLYSPDILGKLIRGSLTTTDLAQAGVYMVFLIIGAVVFSWFWVQTSGMDAKSQAKQIMASGLQIPGFRRDARVLEHLLQRYITPLTVMGAIAVGILAGVADISGALTNGTGLLLTVMIIYKLYEDIARQHMMDMNPVLKKFMA
ncbi:MAG: preprotein translocase subunit SecY [Candidatus Aenigmarchaeota archaeon]|nr:preprotein translocase subunit SecY [Candidatus Aenigmarchaeota archaeon]